MDVINGLSAIGVLSLCLGTLRATNGRMSKLQESKVDKDACERTLENINRRFDALEEHSEQRFKDIHTNLDDKFGMIKDLINAR